MALTDLSKIAVSVPRWVIEDIFREDRHYLCQFALGDGITYSPAPHPFKILGILYTSDGVPHHVFNATCSNLERDCATVTFLCVEGKK